MSQQVKFTGRDPKTGRGIAVVVQDGRILEIMPEISPDELFLSAGLVDLQVNGFGGLDFNREDLSPKVVHDICVMLAGLGTTTFLPTLITASESSIVRALSVIAKAREAYPLVAQMAPGVHIEGPSFAPEDGPRGAHPLAHIRAPSLGEFGRWQEAAGKDLIKLVTLAPEYPGAESYIRALTKNGVHVAIGHTAATPDDIRRAVAAGAVLSTHLGNGAAAMLPRHPNFIWTQLAEDSLTATFIADGHHLPSDTFKAMLRAKGLDRSILVSDSVSLAGMAPGIYEETVGHRVELRADGRIGIAGTPYLAGAGLPLSANVAIAARMAKMPLASALAMATVNPGRFLDGRGRLAVGDRADIVRFSWADGDDRLVVADAWVAGQTVRTG